MGKALYRQYRSKSLSEIIGQEHITDTLTRALKSGRHSHAYLLTGPKGVGKTSIARILAYELNNLPYDDEGNHLDIIEIDAASNRRIDEIRELIQRVHIAPTSAKYKIYIIDEVHMLTREAFNALLKTIEEPPDHAIFILATTESHKVPETIASRTQRFSFKPVSLEKVVAHLKNIASIEKITIDDEALELIAQHGEGSFRDSISLLDQIRSSSDKITLQVVQRAVGQAPNEIIIEIINCIMAGDISAIASALEDLNIQGVQAPMVAKQLSVVLRTSLIAGSGESSLTLKLLENLLSVAGSHDPNLALELAIFSVVVNGNNQAPATVNTAIPIVPPTTKKAQSQDEPKPKTSIIREVQTDPTLAKPSSDINSWQAVVDEIKGKHNTLYGIARMATPTLDKNKLTLSMDFPFHHKRLTETKNTKILSQTISQIMGKDIELEIVVKPKLVQEKKPTPELKIDNNSDLETISNIFGGAEIVH